eukprot:9479926-Pyramimonas_sp.AAC.3
MLKQYSLTVTFGSTKGKQHSITALLPLLHVSRLPDTIGYFGTERDVRAPFCDWRMCVFPERAEGAHDGARGVGEEPARGGVAPPLWPGGGQVPAGVPRRARPPPGLQAGGLRQAGRAARGLNRAQVYQEHQLGNDLSRG